MTAALVLPGTPATPGAPAAPGTPGARGRHAKAAPAGPAGGDGTPAFSAALAIVLGGNLTGSAQAPGQSAEEQGAPVPSAGVTETQANASGASVAGSGSLAAALSGTLEPSVEATGAAAPSSPSMGAAATGSQPLVGIGTTPRDTPAPRPATPRVQPGTAARSVLSTSPLTPGTASSGSPTPVERPARSTAAGSVGQSTDRAIGVPDLAGLATLAAPTAVTQPAATAVTTASPDGGAVTTAVLRQVFPQVTQVATTPGTHRISITLHPESLGEVRVTVVVRPGGAVHVRLAADAAAADGAQARQALLQGAPELRRLLESTGGDVRVVVQGSQAGQATSSGAHSQGHGSAQQSQPQAQAQTQAQAQAQSQAEDGRRRQAYQPGNPQELPQAADLPIGGTTTTSDRSTSPGRVDEHAGRIDRLM